MPARIPIHGAVLRELRWLRCLSQERLAHDAGLHPAQISRYECGVNQPPPEHLQWIVAALDRVPVSAEQRALIQTPALDAALSRNGNGHDVNRREVLKLAAAAGGLVLAGVPIDLGEMSLHQAAVELIGRWPTAAPAASLEAARDLLNRQYRALKTAAMRLDQQRELRADMVDVAILGGWAAKFCDQQADAAACFALAQRLAKEAGLGVLRGEVLTSMATLHRGRGAGDGDVQLGLELARAAQPLLGSRGPAAKFAVWLEADMSAQEDDSLRSLERALAMPEDGGRDGFYARHRGVFCDWASEQSQWAGGCHAYRGRPDEALVHLREATAADGSAASGRSALITHRLAAHAYAVAGEPEPMCDHAHKALDGYMAVSGGSHGARRVRYAREQLPDPCADVDCVRVLDERLAGLALRV